MEKCTKYALINNMKYDFIKYVYIQISCNCNSYESNFDVYKKRLPYIIVKYLEVGIHTIKH